MRDTASSESRATRRRQAEVLGAAAQLFATRGYSGTTVQDVADVLGILKGSLYHYIETKEDLLYRILDEAHDELDAILAVARAREGLAPLDRLEAYVRDQVAYHTTHLPEVTIYYHDLDRLSPARRAQILERRRLHAEYVQGLIAEAQADGLIPGDRDAGVLANCVFATIIWVYRWYRPGGSVDQEQIADVCARFAVSGVCGDAEASLVPSAAA
jgi:AcrR family transcriptional regulator